MWSSLKLFCLNSAAVHARPFYAVSALAFLLPGDNPKEKKKKKKTHRYASLHLPAQAIPNYQIPDSGKPLKAFLATLQVRGRIARAGGALSAFLRDLHSTLEEAGTLSVRGNHWADER